MPQFNKFLQWNIRGFTQHSDELRYLVHTFSPLVVALQETKFPVGSARPLPGYVCEHGEPRILPGGSSHGGVALYTIENLGAVPINLNTSLQAVTVRVNAHYL